ncbi:MAG: tetratricopeptide repeat protein [Mariprofundaceae bacterium]|nr:tetratricopeptide repeat protein [Mariprofundaceae bacterium]
MIRKKLFAFMICAILLTLNFSLNQRLSSNNSIFHPVPTNISPQVLKASSMGYQNLIATYLWFKTIAYFGKHTTNIDYDYLATLFHNIIALNPKFEPVYYMAASVFPWNTQSTKVSKPILLQAMIEFPNDWRWPYYRGFNSYWFEHDYQQAAHFFELSSYKPNAPGLVSSLAARMHAERGNIDTALGFLARLIQNKNDSNTHATLMRQYQQLKTEKQLQEIEGWLRTLPENQRNAQGITRLKRHGYFIPETLEDGGYIMFKDGALMSSHANKRFRVFIPVKRQGVVQDETTH